MSSWNPPWIQTLSGVACYPYNAAVKSIGSIAEIAIVLSRLPRFCGHTRQFYSVAQHSVLVSQRVPQDPKLALPALLHDAHEAYSGFGDCAAPMKLQDIRDIERDIDRVIAYKFGFKRDAFYVDEIKTADLRMLMTEARDLMEPPPIPWECRAEPYPDFKIEPVCSAVAAKLFQDRFFEIVG